MDAVNFDEIAKKVYELSKDSDHYKKQLLKTKKAKDKGLRMAQKIENFKKNERLYRNEKNDTRALIGDLERDRDLTRTWFHIDMDMFYA